MDQGAAQPAKCIASSLPTGAPSFSRFIENVTPRQSLSGSPRLCRSPLCRHLSPKSQMPQQGARPGSLGRDPTQASREPAWEARSGQGWPRLPLTWTTDW